MSTPTTTAQWAVEGLDGFDSLKFDKSAKLRPLGDHDCLVKINAVSLNYRDLIIPKVRLSHRSFVDTHASRN